MSATFIVKPLKPSKVRFQLSEDSLFSDPFYTEEITSDSSKFNFTKIQINNLTPNIKYFYRAVLDDNLTDRLHSFKTFPSEKNYNFSFGFGSFQQGYNATLSIIYKLLKLKINSNNNAKRDLVNLKSEIVTNTKYPDWYLQKVEELEKSIPVKHSQKR